MNRQFDLRPRSAGRRTSRPDIPPRMVLCLTPQSEQSAPIIGERLLIGSDPHCDVCLAGQELPDLHTILSADGHAAWADVVVAEPPLRVNGTETEFCQLHDGDVLEVGTARFEVRFSASTMPAAVLAPSNATAGVPEIPIDEDELSELSAEALVDLLDAELTLVEEFDEGRRRGVRGLLRAAQANRPADTVALRGPGLFQEELEGHIAVEMDQLSARLERLADRLNTRSRRLAEREDRLAEAVAELSAIQEQLDERIADLKAAAEFTDSKPRRRAA